MPRLSYEARRRVISLYNSDYSVLEISKRLDAEKVDVSPRALYNLLQKYRLKGTIRDLPRRKMPQILTEEMKRFMEERLRANDEVTARAMKNLLLEKWPDLEVSIPTIKRVRRNLGWVCTRPHYCQLIREVCAVIIIFQKVKCMCCINLWPAYCISTSLSHRSYDCLTSCIIFVTISHHVNISTMF